MKLKIEQGKISAKKTEAIIIGLFEKEKLSPELTQMDSKINGEIAHLIKTKKFKGSSGEMRTVQTQRKLKTERILLVGLGKKEDLTTEKLRRFSAKSAKKLRGCGTKNFTTTLQSAPVKDAKIEDTTLAVTEGIILGLYTFKKYITMDKDKVKSIASATILEPSASKLKAVKAGAKRGQILATNVCNVRDLVNEPAAVATPTYLASEAKKVAKASKGKVKVKVFGRKEIVKMGMGGLEAVSRASSEEPKFIVMEYNKKAGGDPLVFVGKGITFDSGGLNVKPWQGMEDMRCDMAGAATVISTIKAACELGVKKYAVAIIPTCENMIGPNSFKQGDVLKAYNGKTMEIWHTDAEGRLILADGLSYADKHYKAKAIVDIATLTGASVIALGTQIAALMSTNEKLKTSILDCAKKTDEMTWELPIIDDYKPLVRSDVADVRNTSKGGMGPGTITAGIFLSHFVDKAPWAHFDIGAAGWVDSASDYKAPGGTGVCLRTFINLLETL